MYDLKRFTLDELMLRGAEHYGDSPFVGSVEGESISYARSLSICAATARSLAAKGVKKGDRVIILSENMPQWALAYFSVAMAGGVAVPVLVDFTKEQIEGITRHSEAKLAFTSQKCRSKLPQNLETLPIEAITDAKSDDPSDLAFLEGRRPSESDTAIIVYTSGTTGHSKGVVLSHRNIVWDAWATRSIIEQHQGDVQLSVLPLAHTYESTMGLVTAILQGVEIRYLDRPPSVSALLPALKKFRPTIMLSVPLLIEKIYRQSIKPKLDSMALYKVKAFRGFLERIAGKSLMRTFGGRVRFFGVGGAPLDPEVEGFLGRAGFPYSIGYGLTETSPLIAGAGPFKTFLRSTGPAMKGVQVKLIDPDPATGIGEIGVKGDNVFQGYFKDAERTKEAFTADGWFRTGDLGAIDAEQRIFVRGRIKTMILGASGENIYPEEIESVINAHALILESLVYGDDEKGLVALVRIRPEILEKFENGVDAAEKALGPLLEKAKREVNSRLSSFSKVTHFIFHKDEFEKTPTQKIKRGQHHDPQGKSHQT